MPKNSSSAIGSRLPPFTGTAMPLRNKLPYMGVKIFITLGVLSWLILAMIEQNAAIGIFAIAACLSALLLIRVLPSRQETIALFSAGYFIRSLICETAWLLKRDTDLAFWTGVNDDSSRFYLNSFLPWYEAKETVVDPGFPIVNSLITDIAARLGGEHYLCNVQLPLICGALFAVLIYIFAKEVTPPRVAAICAWLIALSPTAVGWSTGLMRDTVVAAAGWMVVLGVMGLAGSQGIGGARGLLLVIGGSVACIPLRPLSFVAFAGIAWLIYVSKQLRSQNGSAYVRLVVGTCVVVGIVVVALLRTTTIGERMSDSLMWGADARAAVGTSDSPIEAGGITDMIARSGSRMPYMALALYSMAVPFPFYAHIEGPHGEQATMVDYVFQIGGLTNQALLSFWLAGLIIIVLKKRWLLFFMCGPVVYVLCLFNLIAVGQSRWIMAPGYPLCFLSAAIAFDALWLAGRLRHAALWAFLAGLCVYGMYYGVKWRFGVAALMMFLPGCVAFEILLVRIIMEIARNNEMPVSNWRHIRSHGAGSLTRGI